MKKYLVRLLIASSIYILGVVTNIIPFSAEDIVVGKIADVFLYEVIEHIKPTDK